MSFVARLRPELIRVAPPWRTFEETIAGLVAVLAGEHLLPPAAEPSAIQALAGRARRPRGAAHPARARGAVSPPLKNDPRPCLGSATDASVLRRWIVRRSCRGRQSRRGKTEVLG